MTTNGIFKPLLMELYESLKSNGGLPEDAKWVILYHSLQRYKQILEIVNQKV